MTSQLVGYALAAQYGSGHAPWVVIGCRPLPVIAIGTPSLAGPLLWHFNFRGPDEELLVRAVSASTSIALGTSLAGEPFRDR